MRVLNLMSGSPVWGSAIKRRSPQSTQLARPGASIVSSQARGKQKLRSWRAHTKARAQQDLATAVASEEGETKLPAGLGVSPGQAGGGYDFVWGQGHW